KSYAQSHGYVRAAVFGRNPFDTHWYFVRSGFPQSAEIVARLRAIDYWWDGEPTVDFRDGDREPVLPPAQASGSEGRTRADAAGDGEGGSGDPARGGGGEEETGVGHLLGSSQAPEGRGRLPPSHAVRPGLLDALPPDEAGRHRVDPDAEGPELLGRGARVGGGGRLRGRVVAMAGQRARRLDRRDVHDRPPAAGRHLAGRGLGAQVDAREVRSQDLVPLLGGHVEDAGQGVDAGVVDEHVQAAEIADRGLHE